MIELIKGITVFDTLVATISAIPMPSKGLLSAYVPTLPPRYPDQ